MGKPTESHSTGETNRVQVRDGMPFISTSPFPLSPASWVVQNPCFPGPFPGSLAGLNSAGDNKTSPPPEWPLLGLPVGYGGACLWIGQVHRGPGGASPSVGGRCCDRRHSRERRRKRAAWPQPERTNLPQEAPRRDLDL